MWKNYLTTGLRSLLKNRIYAFINIFGLAVGLAACLLLFLFVRYETSYDSWLPDSERIYQVQATWHEPGQPVTPNQRSPLPVHDTIAAGFPQIEAASIAMPGRLSTFRNNLPIYMDGLAVDPAFFDIFRLDFIHGSARTALPDVNSVVLSETEALRHFGSTNVLGRTITEVNGNQRRDYHVTAVIRDLPKNSHLRIASLFRFDLSVYEAAGGLNSWGAMNQFTYVKLRPGSDPAVINDALPAWEKRVIPPDIIDNKPKSKADIMDLKLVPIADVHLGDAQRGAMTPGGDARMIATFAIVAMLILGMACVNFINLSTARAGQRAREVALRKVLGASRRQLVAQFLGESLLLTAVGMVIALAIVEVSLPFLSAYLDAALEVHYFGSDGILGYVTGLTVIVGIGGGLYPAVYLSRFQPAKVLRANKSAGETEGSGQFRNLLVIGQFAVSIGLIICTAIVYSQTRYVQTVDPGFDREGLIQIEGAWRANEAGNYEGLKREIESVPGVIGVARTNLGVAAENKTILAIVTPGSSESQGAGFYRTDPGFFQTMGMRLLAGRLLSDRYANDRVARSDNGIGDLSPDLGSRGLNIVINRRAAEHFGFRDPQSAVGRQIKVGVDGGAMVPTTIVGVVENTRIRSARDAIEPLVFSFDPGWTTQLMVRYRSAEPAHVMNGLRGAWNRIFQDVPFEADFSEDLVARLYEGDQRRSMVFAAFATLAILVASLGLFGLAAFTAQRRTKEIGIRKVLGATVRDILRLLTWQFSKPVIQANLIAWPAAWWVMRDWLNTFDERIALTPGPFVLAAVIALGIALGTIASHALRVARTNPIHALRYE